MCLGPKPVYEHIPLIPGKYLMQGYSYKNRCNTTIFVCSLCVFVDVNDKGIALSETNSDFNAVVLSLYFTKMYLDPSYG